MQINMNFLFLPTNLNQDFNKINKMTLILDELY